MERQKRSRTVQDQVCTSVRSVLWASMVHSGRGLGLALTLGSSALAQLPPPPAVPETLVPPSAYASCIAPALGEYGLLILRWSLADQERVQRVLPSTTRWQLCNYPSRQQNLPVMQVGGFVQLAAAQELGQQVTAATGLPTVAIQATTRQSPEPPDGTTVPQPAIDGAVDYNPRPLGPGYAVLVDFGDRPELAAQLQSQLGRTVGLVSYGQRAYLLGAYTSDASAATATAQDLKRQGFNTQVVEGQQVFVLRTAVVLSP